MDRLIGQMLGPYQVLEKIGEGGMAVVYKGYQPSLGRYVAIKVLRGELAHDQEFITRFRREALAVARLSHPNILHVYDAGVAHGVYYLVMDYVEGGSLKDRMAQAPLDVDHSLSIAIPLAEALDYAHRSGLIHRDIKPSNILLSADPSTASGFRPLLTDFGIAKVLHEATHLTRTGASIGTPEYMAPEQAEGEPADGRTDIYALGIVLYEMLTGRVPFSTPTPAATLYKHVHAAPPAIRQANARVPPWLEAVVLKTLAKRPDDRYQRAADLAHALRHGQAPAADRQPVPPADRPPQRRATAPPRPRGRPATGRRGSNRVPILLAALAAVLLVAIAGGVFLLWGGIGDEPAGTLPPLTTTGALQPVGEPPEVTIIAPRRSVTVALGEELVIQSRSVDDNGVVRVELWADGNRVRVDTSPTSTGQTSFVTVQAWWAWSAGRHSLTVRAYDAQGGMGESSPLLVHVEEPGEPEPTQPQPPPEPQPTDSPPAEPSTVVDDPPEIRILSPRSPYRVPPGAAVPIEVVATDDKSVQVVVLLVNGVPDREVNLERGREVRQVLEWVAGEPGSYRLTVVALDGAGQESAAARLAVNVTLPPDIPPPYGPVWEVSGAFQSELGLPTGEAMEHFYAAQIFQRGFLMWRNNEGAADNWIYAIQWEPGDSQERGSFWARFTDTWREGDPEYSCSQATPPIGPKRGFGRVWCEQPEMQDRLGLPLEEEWGADGGWLDFEGGLMLWDARAGRVFVLFEAGHWEAHPDGFPK